MNLASQPIIHKALLHLIMMLSICISSLALASEDQGDAHEAGPGKHMALLQEELDLSDEQRDTIKGIFKSQHQKMTALRQQMQAIRQETQELVDAELTKKQLKKVKKMRKQRQEAMQQRLEERSRRQPQGEQDSE